MQFVADLEPNADGALQIMYGIDGRRDLTESTRDDLSGYAGREPRADRQRRLRPAPERRLRRGAGLDPAAHAAQPATAAAAVAARAGAGRMRHQGLAQARPGHLGGARQAQALRLLEADVLGGDGPRGQARGDTRRRQAARAAGRRPPRRSGRTSSPTASATAACCASTTRPTRSTPPTCWRRIFGFLPGEDERMRASVLAIAEDLTEDGFVLRYRTEETDDGLSGKEGSFLICSFWLVSGLAIVGELQRARDLMEKLLRVASPLGLYAEEFDTSTGRHLGNFPQAFSHLALIEAAGRIIIAERIERADLMSAYDVIIIGSGAGGGHARAPSRSLGQAHPAARARRLAAARAAELVRRRSVRREPLRLARHLVRRRRQAVPAAGPLLRRRRHQALRRRAVPLPQRGLRRAAPPRRDLARVADLLRADGALLHAGRAALPGARRARRGPHRTAGQRAVPVPGGLARAAHRAARRGLRRRRAAPVPRALRRDARTRATCPTATACAARPATASPAWCTPSPTPRCWAYDRRSSTTTSRC